MRARQFVNYSTVSCISAFTPASSFLLSSEVIVNDGVDVVGEKLGFEYGLNLDDFSLSDNREGMELLRRLE